MSRAKNWCFTLNNYESLLDPGLFGCSFCVYQEELSASGTPHLQGYVQFPKRVTLAYVRLLDGLAGAHWEAAGGTPAENEHYCTKPVPGCTCHDCVTNIRLGGPYHFGQISRDGQGTRSDLRALQAALDANEPIRDLYHSHFATMARVEKFAINYRRISRPPRDWPMTVFVLVGAPKTGKTRTAWKLASMLGTVFNVPFAKASGLYWDDYDGETSVIIDEFDGSRMSPKFFNLLTDRYPVSVQVHGGAGHQFVSRYVFITSNIPPRQWWPNAQIASVGALFRRITVLLKFFRTPPPPVPPRRILGYSNLLAIQNHP